MKHYRPSFNPKPIQSEEYIRKVIEEVEGTDHENFKRTVRLILWSAVLTIFFACLSSSSSAMATLPGDSAYCPMCNQYMPMDHLNVRVGMGFMGFVDGRYVMTPLGYWLFTHDEDKPIPLNSMPDSVTVYLPFKYLTNQYIRAKWNDRLKKTRYTERWHGN